MIGFPIPERVFIYGKPVDMRKSFDGLFTLVSRTLEEDPMSGALFLFPDPAVTGEPLYWPDRARTSHSNYGSAVDCQGWGAMVTTCTYDPFGTIEAQCLHPQVRRDVQCIADSRWRGRLSSGNLAGG